MVSNDWLVHRDQEFEEFFAKYDKRQGTGERRQGQLKFSEDVLNTTNIVAQSVRAKRWPNTKAYVVGKSTSMPLRDRLEHPFTIAASHVRNARKFGFKTFMVVLFKLDKEADQGGQRIGRKTYMIATDQFTDEFLNKKRYAEPAFDMPVEKWHVVE